MKDSDDNYLSSELRSNVLVIYLQNIQWRIRDGTGLFHKGPIGERFPVEYGPIILIEIKIALKTLKNDRAAGPDEIKAEHLKALASTQEGLQIVLDILNICWSTQNVPDDWKLSRIILLYKKGNPSLCEN